jgi:predicted CXXCH cytochrome family protein
MDHPYVQTKDLKAETCLKCHPTKNQGKFVHTAVGMGCENCHQMTSADNETTVTLISTGGDLCTKCHEIRKNPVLHGPYQAGQCLICHNPHNGAYKAQTRATVDTLCLSCHMLNEPYARVDTEARIVRLLDGQIYDLASWESAPKISEGHSANFKPPRMNDSAIGKGPGKLDGEFSCLSCHDPHASKAEHLMRGAAESRGASENLSPGYRNDFMPVYGEPQKVPVFQYPYLGGQA